MKILIAGLGLIGGSFALALRDRGIADEILGVEKSDENAAEALRLGLADRIVTLEEGVPQADLVVLATPVDTIPLMAIKALNHVTDRQVVLPGVKALAEVYETVLKPENELDWLFFSPAAELVPGKRTGKFRIGKDELIRDASGKSSISVEDYAAAMIDELEKPVHHRERFTIGY